MGSFQDLIEAQRKHFRSGATLSLDSRIRKLARLESTLLEQEKMMLNALHLDLQKPPLEAFTSEILTVVEEIRHIRKNLKKWARPRKVPTPFYLIPAKSEIHREPLGAVLIISPWNYPIQLSLAPLVGAIAAGNCVVLKPSEWAPSSAGVLAEILKIFPPEEVAVITGGPETTQELLKERFDHIFFTGSRKVGSLIMEAAAKFPTPVTLELGGKSPAIISASADIDLAAKRIVWGKFLNAGQTCVAPDYVMLPAGTTSAFVERAGKYLEDFFGQEAKASKSYGRIIHGRHVQRLKALLENTMPAIGGEADVENKYVAPTIVTGITKDHPLMEEEIFGPILPVLEYERLEDAFALAASGPKPLAAYLFSQTESEQQNFLQKVPFGGGCINDTILHLTNPYLPFGGTGASGIGSYHGEKSFQVFSHEKSLMRRFRILDFPFRYPPYTDSKERWIRRIFRLPEQK